MNPIILLVGAAAGLYLLLRDSDEASAAPGVGSVRPAGGGMARTEVPTAQGGTYELISTPEDIAAIMAMARGGDPSNMAIMGRQYAAMGKHREAKACEHLSAYLALHQATGGRYSPKVSPAPAVSSQPPPRLVTELAAAVERGDTQAMRTIAAQMRAMGFEGQAASIEGAAGVLESQRAARTTVRKTPVVVRKTTPVLPPIVKTPPPITFKPKPVSVSTRGLPEPEPMPAPTPRRATADLLVKHLTVDAPPKKKESQAVVKAYQKAAGLTDDGLYGPGSAKSLADPASGSHVPPPPRRWPKATYAKAAKAYESWLALKQAQDPARAAEWAEAIKHARDFYP